MTLALGRRSFATVSVVGVLAVATACGTRAGAPSSPTSAGPPSHGAATFGDSSFAGPMLSPAPTKMEADLKALGLDPNDLPPLERLPADVLRKVMKTFTQSLGARCVDCHVEDDYDAPTPRKAIAAAMWNRFVRPLRFADGGALYCDSCHQGRMTPLLDRRHVKDLSQWMDDAFVHLLARRDGRMHDCGTCHGEPFEPHLLKAWVTRDHR